MTLDEFTVIAVVVILTWIVLPKLGTMIGRSMAGFIKGNYGFHKFYHRIRKGH